MKHASPVKCKRCSVCGVLLATEELCADHPVAPTTPDDGWVATQNADGSITHHKAVNPNVHPFPGYANELNRQEELVLAVWAAEFTRSLGGAAQSRQQGPASIRYLAKRAAASADSAVEALRLLFDEEPLEPIQ